MLYMNVMLTCAGRRKYLVTFFREALHGDGSVFAGDANRGAPALAAADRAFILPSLDDPSYVECVLEICARHQVGLLVSLHDLELPLLARHLDQFHAVKTIPVISAPAVIDTCLDKVAAGRFLATCGISEPATYLSLDEARLALRRGVLTFPVVVKPRWGTASLGIEYAFDDEELEFAHALLRKRLTRSVLKGLHGDDPNNGIIIQEKLTGDEYGIDIINDLDGRHMATMVRRKLEMRAGETDRAVTAQADVLGALGARLGRALGHIGNLDCDVIVNNGRSCVLDMNPRFGGGYPLSHLAGANLPAALVAWASGREADPAWLRPEPGITVSKCDGVVVMNPSSPAAERASHREA
jgi:carbamoyl-phosphate synthase large subunit